jgi:putative restriction endonuclease
LNKALSQPRLPQQDLYTLPRERQRVITEVSRLSREAGFRQRVLFAYGNRCAVTRVQLRLVDAAHILPVGAPASVDHVRNGVALSPTYHRAFDAALIFLDEQFRMRLNDGNLGALQQLNLVNGLEAFKAPLGHIFLPPDPAQRPSTDFIRRANRFRQISESP